MIINDQSYQAINLGGNDWMVKRFQKESDGGFVEALLVSDSADPEAVIREAIAIGSWA